MPDTTDPPPPRSAAMDSTQVGTTVNRHGAEVPVTVVHPAGAPAPTELPACLPDCARCTT